MESFSCKFCSANSAVQNAFPSQDTAQINGKAIVEANAETRTLGPEKWTSKAIKSKIFLNLVESA